jgi:carbonic anhydrase
MFMKHKPVRLYFRLFFSLFFASSLATQALAAGPAPHWAYEGEAGPLNWSRVDPAFKSCGTGKRQSPINIETRDAEKGGLKPIPFNWLPGPAEIVNNGHTIQVNLPNSGSARFDGMEYKLVQFHFHTPSEEKIDSMAQHMVAHFVHRAGDSKLAVLGILFKLGKENATLKPVFDNLPKKKGLTFELKEINPADLIPADPTYIA